MGKVGTNISHRIKDVRQGCSKLGRSLQDDFRVEWWIKDVSMDIGYVRREVQKNRRGGLRAGFVVGWIRVGERGSANQSRVFVCGTAPTPVRNSSKETYSLTMNIQCSRRLADHSTSY